MTNWAKWVATLFVVSAAFLGITLFTSARNAALQAFRENSEPAIRKQFHDVVLPEIRKKIETDASKRVDEFTSSSSEQFEVQMKSFFADWAKYAKENNLKQPAPPAAIDSTNRPTSGYVLRSFLTKSADETYLINTFRLNIRDEPNGTIRGRQMSGARVKVTEERGEWVRIEVVAEKAK